MAMQITRAGDYAIRSMLYLSSKPSGSRIMSSEVALAEDIPVNFVRKILESLVKNGLVKSYRGAGGGFTLGRDAADISLLQIIESVEGPFALNECLSSKGCKKQPACPVSLIWQEAQEAVVNVFERYSLADIVNKLAASKNGE